MADSKDLLTIETEHNGESSDYHHSDMDDNYEGTLESRYSKLGKNDSLKSTRSLSVFRDPSASQTMARSEEMTYNIYEDVIEGEPSETTGAKVGRLYSKSSDASRSQGTFQIKTATSPTAVPFMTSDSLRNADFKASLANSLKRRLSSEGNTSGSESKQNGLSHLVSMDPGGRGSAAAKGSASASSTLESTGSKVARKDQWNSLSSATSTSTLTSVDGVGATVDLRGAKSLTVDLSQSEAETDTDRYKSGRGFGGGGESYSSDHDSEVVSHSLPRYSPAEIDVSNSKVKDKDFKAKMAALFGGSGTTSPVSTSAPTSLVRSRKRIEKLDSSENDTESRTSTLSRDLREDSTAADSLHSTLEERASGVQSQRSTTPSDLQDVITQGKVNRLAGEMAIRGVPLTGRSMDTTSPVSSMERQSTSRASNQSTEDGRNQSKKFKFKVEGIDRPSESETNTTMEESEDDRWMEQKRKMRLNLMQDIKNHSGTMEENAVPGDDGSVLQSSDSRSRDGGDTSSARESSSVDRESVEATAATTEISYTQSLTSVRPSNGLSGSENKPDERSMQSDSDETDATLEEEEEPPLLMGRGHGMEGSSSTQMYAGRSSSDREGGTSVSVEITDGSETGYSNNLEDAAIIVNTRDDHPRTQDDSTTADDQKTIGQHVVTLHLTEDNDAESNDQRDRALSTEKEDTVVRKHHPEVDQHPSENNSSSASVDGEADEQRTLRHRTSTADRMNRVPNRPLNEDEPRRVESRDSVAAISQRNRREDEEDESQLTEGSDYSGRQRGQFGGRQKIKHKAATESTSESYVSPVTQRGLRIAAPDTDSFATSSSHIDEPQRPSGQRKIFITGRENIRRITPMNDMDPTAASVPQNGFGRREERGGEEFIDDSGGYPQPSPRRSRLLSEDPNFSGERSQDHHPSQSYDRQGTMESGGHVSLSSEDFPEARTDPAASVWAHPRDPVWTDPHERDIETARYGNSGGGVVIKISTDRNASWNSRRSLTDSERGRQGLYEQNRRRSRQRKPARQVTDSSLTDQEDFENAGHRSSAMRRRMKRHIGQGSRLSMDSDPEDPAIYSEPEYTHRETHRVIKSSTPVTGLISYQPSSSRPVLESGITRSPSVPSLNTRFRPSSAVQLSHRSVTPITGRISVSRTNSIPNLPRSVTPLTGRISLQNGSRPRSAMGSYPSNNYPSFTNGHNLAYPPNSPTGANSSSSYLRSVNVVSPDSAELIGVDPELRDAQKTGNIYHITISIRPIVSMSRPGSVMQAFEVVDTAIRSVPRRGPQSIISNGPRTSWLLTEDDLNTANQPLRSPSSVPRPPSNQRSSPGYPSQNPVAFHLELQGGETIQTKSTSSHQYTTSQQRGLGGGEASVVIDLGNSIDIEQQESTFDGERNGPMRGGHSEKMPNIVRGSILIKNTFDTTNPPQVIDVVDVGDDDDDDATVIEDNSNMFHGKYMSRKENPLYSSNPDLSKLETEEDSWSQMEFAPVEVQHTDSSSARPRMDRDGIGRGVMRGAPSTDNPDGFPVSTRDDRDGVGRGVMRGAPSTGDQGPMTSDGSKSTDYVMPDELEFESVPNGNATSTTKATNTTKVTGTTTNHRGGSGYVDDFDRDVMVTRDRQTERSKASFGHNGHVGQMQNGDASSGSRMMNGGGGSMSGLSMVRTSQSTTSASRANGEQHGPTSYHDPYNDEDFNTEIKVNRDYWLRQKNDRTSNGGGKASMQMTSSSFAKQRRSQSAADSLFAGGYSGTLDSQSISSLNIRSLMVGMSSSVKQTIKVDRLDDEIFNDLPVDELRRREEAGLGADLDPDSAMFDFDKVSEQVDMDISDGKVTLTSRARSERTVPIMGSENMYKKSAVIVTKCIEIDMTLTPQRRQLYELITSRQNNGRNDTTSAGELDKQETLELYKKFAALAELNRAISIAH